ncbi:hypothetical protein Nepgr_003431 [Nepenthes gracilis]|uniref:Pentatricopeptide repeat-containing protein n=1 Tax=Nepenthes gracilis TaxID=150966 RepID=A0AAD3RZL2_NEPGR|nr:hypothetical protein Nepgr_003431 [Nepenthes gracilis]
MYGKCSEIGSSVIINDSCPEKTRECCNALMTSVFHCGAIEEVVDLFGLMLDEDIGFDEFSSSTTLSISKVFTVKLDRLQIAALLC